jgi:uroporphyrinogen-III synthase
MTHKVLVLRPQPGADQTAARARALGLEPVVAPLFSIAARGWEAPDPASFDAVMLTSANALRFAGPALERFTHLPAFAVGEATAEIAYEAGFADIRRGPKDAVALVMLMDAAGVSSVFHPCGEDRVALRRASVDILSVPVYAAEAVAALPAAAAEALADGALALLHSPRAAALFAALTTGHEEIGLVAISAAAAEAAGSGWRSVAVAEQPRDQALLELAAKLCQTGGG